MYSSPHMLFLFYIQLSFTDPCQQKKRFPHEPTSNFIPFFLSPRCYRLPPPSCSSAQTHQAAEVSSKYMSLIKFSLQHHTARANSFWCGWTDSRSRANPIPKPSLLPHHASRISTGLSVRSSFYDKHMELHLCFPMMEEGRTSHKLKALCICSVFTEEQVK